ncbi:MAG TPA: S-layer homology domain-containing protein [Acidimicrobiia bacterium]|nr:S-layer homology domain-containing protein [Acidimicrobiia bacterium]
MSKSRLVLALVIGTFFTSLGGVFSAETARAALCSNSFVPGQVALTDLSTGSYLGQQGGLYPGGSNAVPGSHVSVGMSRAAQVQPRNTGGAPDPAGKVVLVGIGVSNTSLDFGAFQELAGGDPRIAPEMVMVDGGVGGHPIDAWLDLGGEPWGVVDTGLQGAGVAAPQVQVAWVMLPDRNPTPAPFPTEQLGYRDKLAAVLRNLKARFPNLAIAYLSSHSYTGYGIDHPNIEPIGYQHGFGVKWVIQDQIAGVGNLNPDPAQGSVVAPWVAWGPYTWANGLGPDEQTGGQPGRADGLEWACEDFAQDGIHPSATGRAKVAAMLLQHFTSDATACSWFLADGVTCGGSAPAGVFADIAGSPFAAEITWVAQEGITAGCKAPPGALFCPDAFVTRGQMAAFLVRAEGYIDGGGGDLFVDDDGSIFEDFIDKLATAGVTLGCQPPPNARFCPDGLVTRAEMAAFLVRALDLRSGVGANLFVDDDGSAFEQYIDQLASSGITLGCAPPPNALFCPNDFIPRGQMAAFLFRAYSR